MHAKQLFEGVCSLSRLLERYSAPVVGVYFRNTLAYYNLTNQNCYVADGLSFILFSPK